MTIDLPPDMGWQIDMGIWGYGVATPGYIATPYPDIYISICHPISGYGVAIANLYTICPYYLPPHIYIWGWQIVLLPPPYMYMGWPIVGYLTIDFRYAVASISRTFRLTIDFR